MSETPPPHSLFVSHAHADNEVCDRYVEALKKRGLDVWYDRHNIQGGQRLGKEIEEQLERRTALVVLLTPASVASYWVDLEVSAFRDLAAHDSSRLLLPVRIADCPIPLLMRGTMWIDAVSLGFDAAIEMPWRRRCEHLVDILPSRHPPIAWMASSGAAMGC